MRVIAPRPSTGRSQFLDVTFVDGVAIVEDLHPVREAALLQHGYTIEKDLIVGIPVTPEEAATLPPAEVEGEGIEVEIGADGIPILAPGGLYGEPPVTRWGDGEPETFIPLSDEAD